MSGAGEPPDPLGRRAFFTQAGTGAVGPVTEGRRALFSSPQPAPPGGGRRVVVECRTCLAHTPVPIGSLALRLLPSLWLPGRPWSRLMRCPACRRLSWCRLRWRGLLNP